MAGPQEYKVHRLRGTEEGLAFPHPKDPGRAMITAWLMRPLQRVAAKIGLQGAWPVTRGHLLV